MFSVHISGRVRSAFERAAHGELPRVVRLVVATWNERRVRYVCYVDGAISEDLRTALGHVGSLISDDLMPERRVLVDLERVDFPAAVPEAAGPYVVVYGAHDTSAVSRDPEEV